MCWGGVGVSGWVGMEVVWIGLVLASGASISIGRHGEPEQVQVHVSLHWRWLMCQSGAFCWTAVGGGSQRIQLGGQQEAQELVWLVHLGIDGAGVGSWMEQWLWLLKVLRGWAVVGGSGTGQLI